MEVNTPDGACCTFSARHWLAKRFVASTTRDIK
eukprot:COSAG01_NODE_54953_length_328_cov_1.349345_1_plen_32_part_10